jgi:hypothetical protein
MLDHYYRLIQLSVNFFVIHHEIALARALWLLVTLCVINWLKWSLLLPTFQIKIVSTKTKTLIFFFAFLVYT